LLLEQTERSIGFQCSKYGFYREDTDTMKRFPGWMPTCELTLLFVFESQCPTFSGKPSNVHCAGRAEDTLWPSCKLCCSITMKFARCLFFKHSHYRSLPLLAVSSLSFSQWMGKGFCWIVIDCTSVTSVLLPEVEPAGLCTPLHSTRGLLMEEEVGTIISIW